MNISMGLSILLLSVSLPVLAVEANDRRTVKGLFDAGAITSAALILEDSLTAVDMSRPSRETASLLFDIGSCALRAGHLARAEKMFRASAHMYDVLGKGPTAETAVAREGLALALLEQGNTLEAETVLDRSLSTRRSIWGDTHPQTLRSLDLLATLFRSTGRATEATDAYEEVLTGFRMIYGNLHPTTSSTAQNVGGTRLGARENWPSEVMFLQALYIESTLFGEYHIQTVPALCGLGEICLSDGRIDDARDYYRQAIDILSKSDGSGYGDVIRAVEAMTGLGITMIAEGDVADAVTMLSEAVVLHEGMRRRSGAGTVPATFMDSPRPILAHALLLDGKPAEAWTTLESGRGRFRDSFFDENRSAQSDSLDRRLYVIETALSDTHPGESRSDLLKRRSACLATRATFSETADDRVINTVTQETLRRSLADGSAVIGWVDASQPGGIVTRWAYVVRSDRPLVWRRLLDLPGTVSRRLVEDFMSEVRSPRLFAHGRRPAADALWKDRFDPIVDDLDDIDRLYIVTAGEMASVPFAALGPDDACLIDRFDITVGSAARIFGMERRRVGETAKKRSTAFVVADPAYGREDDRDQQFVDLASIDEVQVLRNILGRNGDAIEALSGLPGTAREAAVIRRLYDDVDVMTGLSANETNIRRAVVHDRLARYDILHFGAHALVDPYMPDRSAIVLARTNPMDAMAAAVSEDGLVTAREIRLGWRLDADVVVVSGCETGLGRPTSSSGTLGLTDAFLDAGARTVVSSLWKVDDRATASLMELFYEELVSRGLDGDGPSAALAEAQRRLRNHVSSSGSKPYSSPWAWAGFVISGS